MSLKNNNLILKWLTQFYKQLFILILVLLLLFICIGLITTTKPSSRLSNSFLVSWTSNLDQSLFSVLYGAENTDYFIKNDVWKETGTPMHNLINVVTSIKFGNALSFISNELPGFSAYENTVIIAGEGMNASSYSDESGPPIDEIFLERIAIDTPDENIQETPVKPLAKEKAIFLYSSHNRESFLPHLPNESNPDLAYHKDINITKVSSRLADSFEGNGIGTIVDDSDVMKVLQDNGWTYGKSYKASRPIVEAAISEHDDLDYVIDVHRDSLPRDKTTKEIAGKTYSKVLFVIGAEYKNYEKNLKLATKIHYLIEEKYPGLSRGVITKEGAGSNGVYNQDLFENSFLLEMGGYENTLDEMYRTADVLADVMSDIFYEAEKVTK